MNRLLRPSRLALAALLMAGVALPLSSTLAPSALAQGAPVVLEGTTMTTPGGGTITIPRVEAYDTTLTRDDLAKLFSAATPKEDMTAIATRAKAGRIVIPTVSGTKTDGTFTLRAIEVRDVDAGKVGRFSLGGAEMSFTSDAGAGTFTSNALTLDGLDLTSVVAAARAGDASAGLPRLSRFSWDGGEARVPDKEVAKDAPGGNMIQFKLSSVNGDVTYAGDVPLRAVTTLKGLTITPPKASPMAEGLGQAGLQALTVSGSFAGTYDPPTKRYVLDDYSVQVGDIGTLSLRARFAGIDAATFTAATPELRLQSLLAGSIGGINLRLVNAGGVEKVLAATAAKQGTTPAALQKEAAAMAGQIVPMMLGGAAGAAGLGQALGAFVANPRSITVDVNANGGTPIPFMEIIALQDPMMLLQRVTITAASEGQAAAPAGGASAGGAPAPGTPPRSAMVAPPGGAPAPAPARKLVGLDAVQALVGNSVVGKDADGDPLVEFYMRNGTVKQLSGDTVNTGKWVLKGQRMCFEFPDDGDETCYKVEVAGDVATFTDDTGTGQRYQVVRGNPKNL